MGDLPVPRPRFLVVVLLVGLAGCKQPFDLPAAPFDAGADSGLPGGGVGAGCTRDLDCRAGLACAADKRTCEPPGNKVPGASCILSGECLPGHHCAMGTCKASGMTAEGGACSIEGDCAAGLVCNLTGLVGTCAKAGLGDLGAACKETTGCRAGLMCTAGTCQMMSMMMTPVMGGKCEAEQLATPKVHFQVPRAGQASEDFYRLPFPNDIRIKNGKVSLAGHPVPGAGILPFDVVDRYIKAIEAESTGFSVNPAVYFRFSRNPKLDSIRTAGAVTYYNITPGSPGYGETRHPGWYASTGGEKYICPRWMVVRHAFGAPLRPGDTYAYVLENSITDDTGAPMQQDDDFKAMLAAAAPADADLAAAWRAYAPLRAWIADKKVDAATIVAAAVFTTERLEEPLAKMRTVVRAQPAPIIKGFVKCGDPSVKSPCDDGKTGAEHTRGCMAMPTAYDEYQGTVSVPSFQKGTPPYDQPTDGGGVELDAGGMPKVQRTEDVCFSLTIPKGTAPAAGWPVVVYSHGTGGSYRSFIDEQLPAEFAAGEVPGGAAVPMAMFGYDGILHGPRKGASTRVVTELVYNFLNPLAARDNAMQAAADLFAVARAVESFSAGGIKLDPAKVGLYGHSQGGNAAANAVGREPVYGAVVLSGTGGTLLLSLLHKKQPVNVAGIIPLVLGEQAVTERHPVLNLLQMYLDRADSLNYGRRIFAEPAMGIPARHVLQIFGTGDTYSPVETQRTFASATGLDIVGPVLDPVDMKDIMAMHKLPAIAAPARGNFTTADGKAITAVEAQYAPRGYDGHFVSSRHAAARAAVRQMLGTFVRDGVPTVNP